MTYFTCFVENIKNSIKWTSIDKNAKYKEKYSF